MSYTKKQTTEQKPVYVRPGVPDSFINSIGREVHCKPLSHDYITLKTRVVEKRYRDRGEPLDPPTYSFEAEGGATMVMPHDADTIADPKTTPEEKAAWVKHLEALSRLNTEIEEVVTRSLCLDGVNYDFANSPEYQDWQEEQEYIGTLPERQIARQYLFIRSRLVITAHNFVSGDSMSDRYKLLETCTMLGFEGATPEQISAARDLFRRQMGGGERQDTPGQSETQGE